MKRLILLTILIVFLAGCTSQPSSLYQQQTPPAQQAPAPQNQTQTVPQQPSQQTPPAQQPTPPPSQPTSQQYSILADDKGFYMNNQVITSISASQGNTAKITFQVNTQNVYYGGLDFRGCGQSSGGTKPGGSTVVQFTATSTCTITSYWPASGVVKANLQVLVS